MKLEGKTAIVTGASSGIGAAIARALRAEGARVAGGARRVDRVETDVALELDVTDPASAESFVAAAVEQLGGVDFLVNNAGLALGRDPFDDSTEADEEVVLQTNVHGLIRMTRLVLPHLRDGGHIVNMGSVAGRAAYPNGSLYVTSKFAVHGFTPGSARGSARPADPDHERRRPASSRPTSRRSASAATRPRRSAVYADVALGGPVRPEDVADACSSR